MPPRPQMSVKKAAKLCEEAIVECRKKAIDQNGVDPQKLLIGELVIGSMFWGAKAGEGYGTCQPAGSVAVPHHVVSAALGSSQSGGVQGGTPQHHTADVRWRAQTTVVQGSSPISSPRPTPSSLQRRDVGREGPVPEAQLHACARAVRSSAQVPLPPHGEDGKCGLVGSQPEHWAIFPEGQLHEERSSLLAHLNVTPALQIMMREDPEMEVRTRVIPMAAERAARRHARRTTPAGGKTLVEIGA